MTTQQGGAPVRDALRYCPTDSLSIVLPYQKYEHNTTDFLESQPRHKLRPGNCEQCGNETVSLLELTYDIYFLML